MAQVTAEQLQEALREAGLENAAEGVVFPFGFKIVEFQGEKALQPLTPEEYKARVKRETGRTLSDEETQAGNCVYAGGRCISQGCAGRCRGPYGDGRSWYCICEY